MALLTCKRCGGPVSSEAKACPECGTPVRRRGAGCIGIILVVVLLVVAAVVFGVLRFHLVPWGGSP